MLSYQRALGGCVDVRNRTRVAASTRKRVRVLLVDDSEAVREVYGHMLASLGVEVTEADGGEAAVAAYAAERFDAVFLDVVMPGVDGLEALGRLRRVDPGARVAMLTAERDEDTLRGALAAGAVDYLTKPAGLARLREALDRLLA
jgi:CheY-like chemotaxis protein